MTSIHRLRSTGKAVQIIGSVGQDDDGTKIWKVRTDSGAYEYRREDQLAQDFPRRFYNAFSANVNGDLEPQRRLVLLGPFDTKQLAEDAAQSGTNGHMRIGVVEMVKKGDSWEPAV